MEPVVGPVWQKLLLQAKGNQAAIDYYVGICLAEEGNDSQAITYFKTSDSLQNNAYARRNIAWLLARSNDREGARLWYEKASKAKEYLTDPSIAEEFLKFLLDNKKYTKATEVFNALPLSFSSSRLSLCQARLAAYQKDPVLLETLLAQGFSDIREGECPIDKLYDALLEMKGKTMSECPLPKSMAFQMFLL